MAIAARSCVIAVLTFRSAVFVLQAAALACAMMAGEAVFTVFMFLKFVLAVHLFLDAALLMYEAAQVFLQEPVLPAQRWEILLVVIADWVMMVILLAAGSSSLAVVDYVDRNMRRCDLLPHTCGRYGAAGALTVLAFACRVPVAFLMTVLLAIWDRQAAALPAPAPAPAPDAHAADVAGAAAAAPADVAGADAAPAP